MLEHNIAETKELILKQYQKAINVNADIIVFPELCLTGYPPLDLLLENGFVDDNLKTLNELSCFVHKHEDLHLKTNMNLHMFSVTQVKQD